VSTARAVLKMWSLTISSLSSFLSLAALRVLKKDKVEIIESVICPRCALFDIPDDVRHQLLVPALSAIWSGIAARCDEDKSAAIAGDCKLAPVADVAQLFCCNMLESKLLTEDEILEACALAVSALGGSSGNNVALSTTSIMKMSRIQVDWSVIQMVSKCHSTYNSADEDSHLLYQVILGE